MAVSPLGGYVYHRGGILFLNINNGKQVEVSRFTIDVTHGDLTGIVNGNPKARVPLFRLDLSHAKLTAGKHVVFARGIGLKLTSVAASALNAALGTKLFAAGLKLARQRPPCASSASATRPGWSMVGRHGAVARRCLRRRRSARARGSTPAAQLCRGLMAVCSALGRLVLVRDNYDRAR